MFEHDYKKFPELTNKQLEILRFSSPHFQITEDFTAKVSKVHDGDTITLEMDRRDFPFPLRLLDIDAPELNQEGGHEVQAWLEGQILGEKVEIKIDAKQRVGKYGRLLGKVIHRGMNLNETMLGMGMVKTFDRRDEGQIPRFDKLMQEGKFYGIAIWFIR